MSIALWLTALLGCAPQGETWTSAFQADRMSETIGGPKGVARPGDFILENDRIRVAILGQRPSSGPNIFGGGLVDGDLQRTQPQYLHGHGRDQLAEVFATANMSIAAVDGASGEVAVVNDGTDGEPAVICVAADSAGFVSMLGALTGLFGEFWMRTDYQLSAGDPAVLMRTTISRDGPLACTDSLEGSEPAKTTRDALPLIDLMLDYQMVLGDFVLLGGSIDVFGPGIGFDEAGYVDGLRSEGINTFTDPIPLDFIGGSGDGVSYGVWPADDSKLFIPMFTGSQTAAFGAWQDDENVRLFHYDRWLAIGQGDMGSALDAWIEVADQPHGRVEGQVLESSTGLPLSGLHVFVYQRGAEAPWSEWTTDVGEDTVHDGSFGGLLPPGQWDLVVHGKGRPASERVPLQLDEGEQVVLVLESPQPSSVNFHIRDETGQSIPSKISFFQADGGSQRDPVLGDGMLTGGAVEVTFAPHGQGEVVLPPGDYYAIASRGPEYELDVSEVFTLEEERSVSLDLVVVHSVDTTGWVSADFHVHAQASFDSGVSLEDRTATMVAEGVEFFASSDHDAITDYRPIIEAMGLEPWISSTPGLEVTTLEVGHFLGFPLLVNQLEDMGGALDWTGLLPAQIIDGLRDLGAPHTVDPVVFVGHPRDGLIGYFDQFGFDPYGGEPNHPSVEPSWLTAFFNDQVAAQYFTLNLEAIEVLNAKRYELIRTPTALELAALADNPGSVSTYDLLVRDMEEQQDLADGVYTLGEGHKGQVDDWFTLLNLGYRITALGNSDTHGKTSTEAGCPRNYVASTTDQAAYIDEGEIAEAVREGRVVTSYGPFVRFYVDDESQGPGSTISGVTSTELSIEVSSPTWFDVDRVELYQNGTLIWEEETSAPIGTLDLETSVPVTLTEDAWFVVIALGASDLAPVFSPVEIAPIQLADIVQGALAEVELAGIDLGDYLGGGVPVPATFPIHPFAITNPIWFDLDGNGFDPPGLPDWLLPPEAMAP